MAKGKELTGVLFKNDKRESDKHPLYKGQCMVGGVEYWLAAWINEGEKGKYMSLKFTAKDEGTSKPKEKAADDDIPW